MHGLKRKLLYVTGGLAVLDGQEMVFGEMYIITLCNIHTTQTLFGMSTQDKIHNDCIKDAFKLGMYDYREQQYK